MKVVKTLYCKNSLLLGLLFVVTFFPILMVVTDAHAELLTLKNGNNSSTFEIANNKTSTTTTNASSIENNIDNKTISQQVEILKLKQNDVVEVGNNNDNNSSLPSENATQTEESAQTETQRSSLSKGNVTIEVDTDSEFQSPAVSFVENEGEQLTETDYQNNYRDFNSDDEHDEYESSSSSRDNDRDSDREHDEYESSSSSSRDNDRDSDREHDEYESSSSSSRDNDRNSDMEHDEGKELLESDSDYNDYLLMLKKMKEYAELDKERENRVTEEIPKDNSEVDAETREEEEEEEVDAETREEEEEEEVDAETREEEEEEEVDAETREEEEEEEVDAETREEEEEEEEFDKERLERNIYEGRLERYLEPNKEQTINYNNKLLSDTISSKKINDEQRYGAPIDNENKKLLSQFTKVDSSPVIPDLQVQTEKSKPTIKDSKLVANAGLDQILRDETRIVLDASSSFSSDGNISNFLWKQVGDVAEEKIKPSNSRIYSFPIPEDVEENTLEFELTVMDKNGQKASDTIKILLEDEQNQKENNDNDVEEESQGEQPQIQAADDEDNQDEEDEEEVDEDNEDEDEEDGE
jgi:hypothetical protein